jgi:hypothetical protein
MATVNISHTPGERHRIATKALAIVGFIALLFIGLALAVYAARYVPTAISRLGAAAVSLSEVFVPGGSDSDLEVIPTGETIPFGDDETATSTGSTATSTPNRDEDEPRNGGGTAAAPRPRPAPVPVAVAQEPFGQPDLVATITGVGYCTSSSADSFRTASEVPEGERGGVRFVIRNAGTNVSGQWEFEVELPTSPAFTYDDAPRQSSLRPNDSKIFTLCFDRPREGSNRSIEVTVDPDRDVSESNENNNSDTETIDIEN